MLQETQTGDNGYSLYRCQKPGDGGHVSPGNPPESGMLEDVDKYLVVPYSPLLLHYFAESSKEVMQPCLLLQMKCRTGFMRLPLINKDDTLVGPEPVHDEPDLTNKDVLSDTSYDVQALLACMAENVPRLTPNQQQAVIVITGTIGSERGGIVFSDAPGGMVKTFLLNLLLAFVRKEKDMAGAVASSGLAATLLAGGRTAHSGFKLLLNLARSDNATCNISKGT
ncbi:ATP-dependent DNA helicase [Trichonephila clavipes]|nr:ATP-dependent DNA helicase [Trichonephila clavipes]